MVTIFQALSESTAFLKKSGSDSPRLDGEIILAHVLGCSRLHVMTQGDRVLSEGEYDRFSKCIKIRAQGMPVAYITGRKEFMGLDFIVKPGILIPRADTEVVVENAIKACDGMGGRINIADVGCGSGAIGVSIAHYIGNAFVTMIDISDCAVDISSQNAALNHVEDRVRVIKGDLLLPVMGEKFHVVVSNPPYIETGVIASLQRDVKDYEPRIALDGGHDGLEYYRKITRQAGDCIEKGGMLVYEIGSGQAKGVMSILSEHGFEGIRVNQDLSGLDRCVSGRKQS